VRGICAGPRTDCTWNTRWPAFQIWARLEGGGLNLGIYFTILLYVCGATARVRSIPRSRGQAVMARRHEKRRAVCWMSQDFRRGVSIIDPPICQVAV
jgi:hypothetical protein